MGRAGSACYPTAACRIHTGLPLQSPWNVTSLAALQNHHDKLAHIQVGRVKGFVLLQETNWTPAQPATLTTVHPHINIAACNLPPDQTGSGGVCILPIVGWTQIEHTEVIPGFLQDALYEKYGAQVRVINVYVHPARTKEIGLTPRPYFRLVCCPRRRLQPTFQHSNVGRPGRALLMCIAQTYYLFERWYRIRA